MSQQPFTRIVWVIYCSDCKVEMPGSSWPSHYRTKAHRKAVSKR